MRDDPQGEVEGGGLLTGVGVGPGDPELITARALRVLSEADRVVAPTTAEDAVGRAEAIVRQALPGLKIERILFEMTAGRQDSASQAADQLLGPLDGGDHVAFVTLGDPNVYSTFSSLVDALRRRRPRLRTATVPGIMAFQELAARSGSVVLDGTERLALVTALEGTADLEAALSESEGAVVVYKGGRHMPAIARLLESSGRLEGAVFGELLGLPGERVAAAGAAGDQPASYLATVIVPPVRRRPSP